MGFKLDRRDVPLLRGRADTTIRLAWALITGNDEAKNTSWTELEGEVADIVAIVTSWTLPEDIIVND